MTSATGGVTPDHISPPELNFAPARQSAGEVVPGSQSETSNGVRFRIIGNRIRVGARQYQADDPQAALKGTTIEDVPWLYWTAASWGADLSLAPNQLLRVTELATVRALLNRAKALDEKWESGAIHEALIAFDGLPPLLGGSPAAARADFDRAMELSDRKSVFAYVALAATTADPGEKRKLLEQAVAIDAATMTSRRLTNLLAQRYARALLSASR